ncbi:sensor histidine kinase [uncultured Caulobacter sp.]|uniref:sensor histidine kinase n=1 Tax=uncultured Caulobacter sp. TaxID=158749 RepID=UPI002633E47A|nr:sensor histidine kinase [uncultured Caulobacter sp.]
MAKGSARIGWAALLVAFLLTSPTLALDPQRAITQYKHTRWTVEDGVPAAIEDIAQTPDGYLWLGTPLGLYRFDGVTFEPLRPPRPTTYKLNDRVVRLMVTRNGALWVGYEEGGLAVIEKGKIRLVFDPRIFRSVVHSLAEDQDGAIWATTSNPNAKVVRFSNGAWEILDPLIDMPDQADWVFIARDGAVWIAGSGRVARMRPGEPRFTTIQSGFVEEVALAEDRRGSIWAADARGVRIIQGPGAGQVVYPLPTVSRQTRIFFDRDDSLWGARHPDGVLRIRPSASLNSATPAVDRFSAGQGLSSEMAYRAFEDREGNIWVGTVRGLDRFRPAAIAPETVVPISSPYGYGVFSDAQGAVYVYDTETLYKANPGQPLKPLIRSLGPFTAMCDAPNGGIWMGLGSEVLRVDGDRVTRIPDPPFPNVQVTACAMDAQGHLWGAGFRGGLVKWDGRTWTHAMPEPLGVAVTALLADSRGRIVADGGRNAVLIDGAEVKLIKTLPRRQRGGTMPMANGPLGVISGSDFGLTRFRETGSQFISRDRFPFIGLSHGLAQTATETWLLGAAGLVRMRNADLERAFEDPKVDLPARIYDLKDGLPGPASYKYRADLAIGGDGRVWMATTAGIASLDPARLPFNTVAPPVSIKSVLVDGKRATDGSLVELPKGARSVQIDYVGLSLASPERVRFRYRLEGVDDDWVEAGGRRQAFYTNLKPGKYVFRVRAANADGVWNEEGASVTLDLPPTLVQSRLFQLLCVVLGLALLAVAFQWRMGRLAERLQASLRERIAERERIARELHDTLLQGVQGLILTFQSAARQVPADLPARNQLERALDRAEAVVIEARDRVRSLRVSVGGDLLTTLRDVADAMRAGDSAEVVTMAVGRPIDLHPLVADEVERIVVEALFNAHRHARASLIEVIVTYESERLRINVRDNGVGIDPAVLEVGGRDGHFGLAGMRERARKIRASLTVRGRPEGGTDVELVAPGAVAYARRRIGWPSWLVGPRRGLAKGGRNE